MSKNFRILGVVPARGNSKRIPQKNLHPLGGKPLLQYTIEALKSTPELANWVVSTESKEVAEVAQSLGAQVIFRPQELALDTVSTESVLIHVLDTLEKKGEVYEWVLTVPPTNPFRSHKTIENFLNEFNKDPYAQDCLMTVTESRDDFWILQKDGYLKRLFENAPRRQQEREPLFEENSALYLTSVKALLETQSVLGKPEHDRAEPPEHLGACGAIQGRGTDAERSRAELAERPNDGNATKYKVRGICINPIEAFDINTLWDIKIAEVFLKTPTLLETGF